MTEKTKLSETLRLAASNKKIKQGFGSYIDSTFRNRVNKVCACALGACYLSIDYDKNFRNISNPNIILHTEILSNFPELSNRFSFVKFKDILLSFEGKISKKKIKRTKEYFDNYIGSTCSLFGLVTTLNDDFKWTFLQIADFIEYLGI